MKEVIKEFVKKYLKYIILSLVLVVLIIAVVIFMKSEYYYNTIVFNPKIEELETSRVSSHSEYKYYPKTETLRAKISITCKDNQYCKDLEKSIDIKKDVNSDDDDEPYIIEISFLNKDNFKIKSISNEVVVVNGGTNDVGFVVEFNEQIKRENIGDIKGIMFSAWSRAFDLKDKEYKAVKKAIKLYNEYYNK